MIELLDVAQAWVDGTPLATLYFLLGIIAFVEGVFPPMPADVVVAFVSFLAARRGADFFLTALSIVLGSVGGSMAVYAIARRFGSDWFHARLRKAGVENLEQRLELMYSRYGMTALFVSRFVPGLRALAPPMSGATRIPPVRTAIVFFLASGLWYGAIAWIAFRVGDDWESLQRSIGDLSRGAGLSAVIAALVLVLVALIVIRRRRHAALAHTREVVAGLKDL